MEGSARASDAAGVPTNTWDSDCEVCKCDLYMSAVVSARAPARAVCPELASSLGPPPDECVLLYK